MNGHDYAMLLAPHWVCLAGSPEILWTIVVSDLLTAVAYLIIPASLDRLAARQTGAVRARTHLIQAFVLACGCNHILMVVTMFVGGAAYQALALTKICMAAISIATATVFWRSRRQLRAL
jgi:hypothetical protein